MRQHTRPMPRAIEWKSFARGRDARAVGQQRPNLSGEVAVREDHPKHGKILLAPLLI